MSHDTAVNAAMIATAVIPILVSLFIAWMLLKLRRRARPDRACEALTALFTLYALARAARILIWPGGSSWEPLWSGAPLLLIAFGLLGVRLYQNRHAVWGPPGVVGDDVPATDLHGYVGWWLHDPDTDEWVRVRTVRADGDYAVVNGGTRRLHTDQQVTLRPGPLRPGSAATPR